MAFVKNYGLFWKRDLIQWGSKGPGQSGSIFGYAARSTTPVDFRDQAGVYVLYDGADIPSLKVTYVGQVGRKKGDSLLGRLRNHRDDHLWNRWTRFSWFGVFAVGAADQLVHTKVGKNFSSPLTSLLDHLEGVIITLLEPPKNKRGANWAGARQYFQEDGGSGDIASRLASIEELLEQLAEK